MSALAAAAARLVANRLLTAGLACIAASVSLAVGAFWFAEPGALASALVLWMVGGTLTLIGEARGRTRGLL